jgi:hypothetical protein
MVDVPRCANDDGFHPAEMIREPRLLAPTGGCRTSRLRDFSE